MSSSSSRPRSRYAVYVGNISSRTPTRDVRYELGAAGRVRALARLDDRSAVVEFDRSADADYAWRKLDGLKLDGRRWEIEYATPGDFKAAGWSWFEGGIGGDDYDRKPPPPAAKASSRRSPSHSRSPHPRTPKGDARRDGGGGGGNGGHAARSTEEDDTRSRSRSRGRSHSPGRSGSSDE